ncbi:WxcM-like domain-containing protein [Pseudomonas putida CSV86]|uniref:WxcM-like domain-containing protein n=1 Tax=Pseudomonas bharatica CSV86 TaxID=1005395 RepID=A0A7K4EAE5_9PSED|nr:MULTISPECIES: FdtA/QdtA family cupin domain-containing protein [Pseudomonas]MDG9883148.1 FdtA/QdtA family cupin domain-containing protein [Pseudomonas sp. GD04058]NNJ14371.1 WxcM-like domain-containing protein [Pseudomonas bharatica CSV86]
MNLINLVEVQVLGDDRGHLSVLEANKNIPFDIRRVYYLTGTQPGVARGFHAHKELEQMAVCVAGSCRMIMDDGLRSEEVILDSPAKVLHVGKMVWHEMHDFTEDCVLLVLANDYYDESDYIRNYEQFLQAVASA